MYSLLTTPSDCDDITQIILQVLYSAFSALIAHLVQDHLPGGKFNNPSDTLCEQTKSVPTTNTISERDFGKLDRLLKEKPNATTLSLEALILFSSNKTARWLNEKSDTKEEIIENARICAPEFKKLYHIWMQKLREERAKILKEKEIALQQLEFRRKVLEQTNFDNQKWKATLCSRGQ